MAKEDVHGAQASATRTTDTVRPKVRLVASGRALHRGGVQTHHRRVLLAGIALGFLIAMLGVGRVQAAGPAWTPSPTDSWQYQLSGRIDTSVDAGIFDIDAFSTKRAVIATLHASGQHAVCYIDAGSWEPYRPDAGRFPAAVIGKTVDGWPGERWLDIRRLDVLKPILQTRIARCANKSFDGVEFDWADSYLADTGFDLTRGDQLRFDRWLAGAAHAHGLAVGLKNALPLVPALVGTFDFAVNEQCFQYHECGAYGPFLAAHKAVLNVEYVLSRDRFCARAAHLGIVAMRKHLQLDAWRRACP